MTERAARSPAAIARHQFSRHPQAMVGLCLLTALALLALVAPLIAPFDPTETDLVGRRLLGAEDRQQPVEDQDDRDRQQEDPDDHKNQDCANEE